MAGAEVVAELVRELEASAEAAAGFEGEMRELGRTAQCAPQLYKPPALVHLCSPPASATYIAPDQGSFISFTVSGHAFGAQPQSEVNRSVWAAARCT